VQLIRTRLPWVSAAALTALVSGCFYPHLLGTHCDAQGGCPSPYICNANHVCLLAGAGSGGSGGASNSCPFSGAGAGGSSAGAGSWSPSGTIPTGAGIVPLLLTYGIVHTDQTIIAVRSDATIILYTRDTTPIANFSVFETLPSDSSSVSAAPLMYPQNGVSVVMGTTLGVYMLAESATTDADQALESPIPVIAIRSGYFHGGGVALYEDVVATVDTDLRVWDAMGAATDVSGYKGRILPGGGADVTAMAAGRFHPDVQTTDPEDLLLAYMTGNTWALLPGSASGLQPLSSSTAMAAVATARPWSLTTIRRDASGKPDVVAVTNPNDQNLTIVAPSTVQQPDGSWPTQSRRLGGGVISAAFGHVLCGGGPGLVLALQTGDIWILPTDDGGLCDIQSQEPIKIPGQQADFVATAHITADAGGPDDILVHAIGNDVTTVLTTQCH
jgi:hypothetical protein